MYLVTDYTSLPNNLLFVQQSIDMYKEEVITVTHNSI